jgi:hypothetical protein
MGRRPRGAPRRSAVPPPIPEVAPTPPPKPVETGPAVTPEETDMTEEAIRKMLEAAYT